MNLVELDRALRQLRLSGMAACRARPSWKPDSARRRGRK